MTDPEDGQKFESPARADADRAFGELAPQVSPKVRERILREGLAAWREEGLIGAEQHDRLLARAGAVLPGFRAAAPEDAFAEERQLGRGVTVLVNLGAIILAAGLIVFFASNWSEFDRPAKVASLLIMTAGFYVLASSSATRVAGGFRPSAWPWYFSAASCSAPTSCSSP